jgi:hypothetical protein
MAQTQSNKGLQATVEALQVKAGEPEEDDGQTTLSVERSGRFDLDHEGGSDDVLGEEALARKSEPISGDIRELLDRSPDEVFHLAETVNWDRPFPPRPGIPDEAVLEWVLRTAKGVTIAKMWLRDAERDDEVAPLLRLLRSVVAEASQNRLFL